MRILLVNETWGLAGGQEEYILRVGNGLVSRGHSVLLIHGRQEGELPKTQFENRLIPGLEVSAVLKEVKKFLSEVVNLQNVFDPNLINELNQNYPTTRFVHDHSTYCPGNSKYFFNSGKICPIATSSLCLINAYKEKCMTRRPLEAVKRVVQRSLWLGALKALPMVICNSRYVKERLIQNGLNEGKIVVNHLFPGHNFSGRDDVSRGKWPEILFVGRLFKEKGVDLLLKACSSLMTDYRLKIVGAGWEKDNLIEIVKDLKVEDRVEFLGFKTGQDLIDLYRQASIFVLPSLWPEPFGMVGLEANAASLPVLAFNVGGIGEWLEDGVNGFLIEPSNVAALAEKIELLLKDAGLSRRLGQSGRERVQKIFSLKNHLDRLEEVFARVRQIDRPSPSS